MKMDPDKGQVIMNSQNIRGRAFRRILCSIAALGLLAACTEEAEVSEKHQMLIYCGITMVHPMREIADIVEKERGVKIAISQGGSEDLYQSLKASKVGDLYIPGSESYRSKHLNEGLLGDYVHVGYNKAALFVAKGNPKKIDDRVENLARKDLAVVIVNPESGSIGRETKLILDEIGIFDKVFENSSFLTTASRNLNQALKSGEADLVMNWRATGFFAENVGHMYVIDIDPALSRPK